MTKARIAASSNVAASTQMADDVVVDDFCLVGGSGTEPTVLGSGSHVRSHVVIYHGVTLGEQVHIGHGVLIREYSHLGNRVSIGSHTVIEHHVEIEDDVRVHSNVFIPELTHLETGVWVGPCVVFTNARYPGATRTKEFLTGVHVERGAKIGAGVVVLPGVRIGAGALIGAGSVITKDVPAGMVVVGNPGRQLVPVQRLTYEDGSPVYDKETE